jgi:hypothetical protein
LADLREEDLKYIGALAELRALNLSYIYSIYDAALLEHLATLKNLVALALDNNEQISSEGIEQLKIILPNLRNVSQ